KDSYCAYMFALHIPGADIKYCQEHACKAPEIAYMFARDIVGADVWDCQHYACKNSVWAYHFAKYIPKSDKEYCFKHAYPEEKYGSDRWKSEYNKFIMQKACE